MRELVRLIGFVYIVGLAFWRVILGFFWALDQIKSYFAARQNRPMPTVTPPPVPKENPNPKRKGTFG